MICSHKEGQHPISGDYEYISYELFCDKCNNSSWTLHNIDFYCFDDCLNFKKGQARKYGWTCLKVDGKWKDICPKCNGGGSI